MRKILTVIVLNLLCLGAFSQMPAGGFRGGAGGANAQSMNIGHFYGKLVDSKTNKALESVTVQLLGNKFDTATKKMKEVIFSTLITNHILIKNEYSEALPRRVGSYYVR